jgi:hypothetical protein
MMEEIINEFTKLFCHFNFLVTEFHAKILIFNFKKFLQLQNKIP